MKLTFTQLEIEQVEAAAHEKCRWLDSHFDRFASPAERKDVGLRINPSTAQVFCIYAEVLDPYNELDLAPEWSCIGRQFYAFDPRERVAVHFYDLPALTHRLLEGRRTGRPPRARERMRRARGRQSPPA